MLLLSPNNNNRGFIIFLVSDEGQNVMANINLSIHVESGSIFYQNFNTNENFYSFFIAQQDETKAIIPNVSPTTTAMQNISINIYLQYQ